MNNDIYEGSWKENLRHGMGTYVYADTGMIFMGTWIKDRMQGPGQLIHARYRFHGFWKLNLVRNENEKVIAMPCISKLLSQSDQSRVGRERHIYKNLD